MNMVACAGVPSTFAASRGRVLFGLMVMLVGAFFLADRFDWWGVRVHVPLWPWVLLVLGVARWSASADGRRPLSRTALWFIAIGVWGLITEYHLFGLGYRRGWPLLVLIAGVFIVWRAVDPPAHRYERGEPS
jgi:hypothetical protein